MGGGRDPLPDELFDQQPLVMRIRGLLAAREEQGAALARGERVDWDGLAARDLLAVLAEHGGVASIPMLRRELDVPEEAVRHMLDDLEERGLARIEVTEKRGYEFAHVDLDGAFALLPGPPRDVQELVLDRAAERPADPPRPPRAVEPPTVGRCGACGKEGLELRRDGRCGACFWSGFQLKARGPALDLAGAVEHTPKRHEPRRRDRETEVPRGLLGDFQGPEREEEGPPREPRAQTCPERREEPDAPQEVRPLRAAKETEVAKTETEAKRKGPGPRGPCTWRDGLTKEDLTAWREKRGLTFAGAGELLGVTATAISKWERGASCPPAGKQQRLRELMEEQAGPRLCPVCGDPIPPPLGPVPRRQCSDECTNAAARARYMAKKHGRAEKPSAPPSPLTPPAAAEPPELPAPVAPPAPARSAPAPTASSLFGLLARGARAVAAQLEQLAERGR